MRKGVKGSASKCDGKCGNRQSASNKNAKAPMSPSLIEKIDNALVVSPHRILRSEDKNKTFSTPTQASGSVTLPSNSTDNPTTPQAQTNSPIEGDEAAKTKPPQKELSKDGEENDRSNNGGGNIDEIIGTKAIETHSARAGESAASYQLGIFQH